MDISNLLELVNNPIGYTVVGVVLAIGGLNLLDPMWLFIDNLVLGIDKIFNLIPIAPIKNWAEDRLVAKIDARIARNEELKKAIKK